jgi:alpha-beta hydrolase superfamily lysophospholipase
MIEPTWTRADWTAPDGVTLPYARWEAGAPRAIIVAVHGLSGAALDYEPLGRHFAPRGFTTYALELRGQGNDPVRERRGDLAQLGDWFSDLHAFLALVRARHPGLPLYYYGESMGAALLTGFLAQAAPGDQPAGLVLASPVVAIPGSPGWWQKFVFHFFLFITPRKRIDVSKYTKRRDENDPKNWVTRDAAHRKWFDSSDHKLTSFTFRFFKCLFDLMGGCFDAARAVTPPVLVLYAKHDVFIPPQKVEEFFARLGSADKEICFFPESYHLLLHDFDKVEALNAIERWLDARMVAQQGDPKP